MFRQQAALVEWQTKRIVEFVAATVPTDKGKGNPLLEQAQKVGLHLDGEDDSSEENAVQQQTKEIPPEVFIEQGAPGAAEKNRPGSFEALMQGLRN
jgi:hypothetical protein